MEKKKVIDLIKLEVLGCLNENDFQTLTTAKESDEDFPWKELGEHQNLAALLPLALPLQYPSGELKDKVALKLYTIRDEIKAKIEAKKKLEEPPAPEIEEEIIIEEEIKVDETPLPVQDEMPVSNVIEKTEPRHQVEEYSARTDLKSKVTFDKELVEKTIRDYSKIHIDEQLNLLKHETKRNFLISLVLFAVSLILIVILFLRG